ncbi:MAG: methyltransferase domain-containing protein, partial [Planctomycetota bacterium JB042]
MTTPRLYEEFADWWPAMSAPADYAEEAALFRRTLEASVRGRFESLVEFGSGGGHTASHLKDGLDVTLVEPSPGMRARAEALNPECAHADGDMRTVRLGRTFDAVLVHDAVAYLTAGAELSAAMETAFVHCRPGGAALVGPDDTLESVAPATASGGEDRGGRARR